MSRNITNLTSVCVFFLGGGKSFIQTSHNRGPDIVRAILSLQDLCNDPRSLVHFFLLFHFPVLSFLVLTWLFRGFKEKTYEIYCTYTVTLGE